MKCFSNTPYAFKDWGEKDSQTISEVETTSSTKEVTSVDAD